METFPNKHTILQKGRLDKELELITRISFPVPKLTLRRRVVRYLRSWGMTQFMRQRATLDKRTSKTTLRMQKLYVGCESESGQLVRRPLWQRPGIENDVLLVRVTRVWKKVFITTIDNQNKRTQMSTQSYWNTNYLNDTQNQILL